METAGSYAKNKGNITVVCDNKTIVKIGKDNNGCSSSIFTVPKNKHAHIVKLSTSCFSDKNNELSVRIDLKIRKYNSVFISTQICNYNDYRIYPIPIMVPEKSDIKLTVINCNSKKVVATGSYELILRNI